MTSHENLHFLSDGFQLTGTLHLPDRPRPNVVIGCHGLLADSRSPKQIALADALNRIGLAYLRFDHRGCGDSQGRMVPDALLEDRCRDLRHAMAFLETRPGLGRVIGLFGSSFGGTVVLATAAGAGVPAIVAYATPVSSRTVSDAAGKQIQAHNAISDQDLTTMRFDTIPDLGSLSNILVMHGTSDEIVPPEHARRIYAAARDPKRLICFEGGDHRMSDPGHQARFIEACLKWFEPFAAQ